MPLHPASRAAALLTVLQLALSSLRLAYSAELYGLKYNPKDFVVAQPSCVHRLPLTQFSRVWRGEGVRTYTVLNNTDLAAKLNKDKASREYGESYGYWEDDSKQQGTWRGGNVGDTRAAVTPFMAHQHFGDTYKWMLYGDDDTMYYMTGVLKLLSLFDPEQPLAITDNIWFASHHPSPYAPRCLPCSFNTSTVTTNLSFTPRPACPFCTRALACGTYSPAYHCSPAALQRQAAAYGAGLTSTPVDHVDADAAHTRGQRPGGGAQGGGGGGREADAMRRTAGEYAAWMARHVSLKERYPLEYSFKPTMDWEMRDGPEPNGGRRLATGGAGSSSSSRSGSSSSSSGSSSSSSSRPGGAGSSKGGSGHRKRRGRRRLTDAPGEAGGEPAGPGGHGAGAAHPLHRGVPGGGVPWRAADPRPRGLLGAKLGKDVEERFLDGTPWLAAALGLGGGGGGGKGAGGKGGAALQLDEAGRAQLQQLRLPDSFCAVHDERLHSRVAQSCTLGVTGHGGSGIIFSIGLMRAMDPQAAIEYIKGQKACGGGDCLLSRALWHRMGIGFTDPGSALQWGQEDYSKYVRFIDSNVQMSHLVTLADPVRVLLNPKRKGSVHAPACDRSCVWLIENVVGTHVRAHTREVGATVDEMRRHLSAHRTAYEWVAEARRDPEVAAGRRTVVDWVRARYGNATAE